MESAHRSMTDRLDRPLTSIVSFSGRRLRRRNLRIGFIAALAWCALMSPVLATAQEANMWTTVAVQGSGTVISRINLDEVKPKPATEPGLSLPSLTLIDDGSGPRVTSLVLELPILELEGASVVSRLGDQSLPAVFRTAPLAGSALRSPVRGAAFTTTG